MNVDEVKTVPKTPIIIRSRLPTPEEQGGCLCKIEHIFADQAKFIKFEHLTLKTTVLKEDWAQLIKTYEPGKDTKEALEEILEKLYSDEMLNSIPDENKLEALAPAFYLALQCNCSKHLRNDEVLQYVHQVAENGDLVQLKSVVDLIDDWNQPLDNITPLMKASSKGDIEMVQFMLGLATLKHLYHKAAGQSALTMAAKNDHEEIVGLLKEKCEENNKCMLHGEIVEPKEKSRDDCQCDGNTDELLKLMKGANVKEPLTMAKKSGCLKHLKIIADRLKWDKKCRCIEKAWNNFNWNGKYKESFRIMITKMDQPCSSCFLASEWEEAVNFFGSELRSLQNRPKFEAVLKEIVKEFYDDEIQDELWKMNEKQRWKVARPAYLLAALNGCFKHTMILGTLLPEFINNKFSNLTDLPLKIMSDNGHKTLVDYLTELVPKEDQ